MEAKKRNSWDGEGKEENPFQIWNEEDLTELADAVSSGETYGNKYFRVEDNIALTQIWPGIGSDYNKFSGNFDGNGYKVSGLRLSMVNRECGLFGSTSSTARITNLDIEGEICVSPDDNWWGMAVGSNRGYIGNCSCKAKIRILLPDPVKDCYVGLIAGSNQQGSFIENCRGTAEVAIDKAEESGREQKTDKRIYIGGVTALNQSKAQVIGCVTTLNGDFSGILRSAVCVGGITAKNYKNGVIQKNTVSGAWKLRNRIYGLAEENKGKVSGCICNGTLEIEMEGEEGLINGGGGEDSGEGMAYDGQAAGKVILGSGEKITAMDVAQLWIYGRQQAVQSTGPVLKKRGETGLKKTDIYIVEDCPLIIRAKGEVFYRTVHLCPGGYIEINANATLDIEELKRETAFDREEIDQNLIHRSEDGGYFRKIQGQEYDIIITGNQDEDEMSVNSAAVSGGNGGNGGNGLCGGDGADGGYGFPGVHGTDGADGPDAMIIIRDLKTPITILNIGSAGGDGQDGGDGGSGGNGGNGRKPGSGGSGGNG